jgi:hypothetical protein
VWRRHAGVLGPGRMPPRSAWWSLPS